jgi:hypothetical protein
MNGEQRGGKSAARRALRHARKNGEHQEHVEYMQEHVRDVIAVRPVVINRGIEHQRQPSQRDPVGVVELCDGPPHAGQFQAIQHEPVPFHIGRIVENDEAEAARLSVDGQRQRDQERAQNEV